MHKIDVVGFRNGTCELATNEALGRFVRATRDISAGELLLIERPAVVGPTWSAPRCCLNCYSDAAAVCRCDVEVF